MIVWLASYPRSGNTLLRTLMQHCFDIKTYSIYDDTNNIGTNASLMSIVGHVNHNLDKHEFHAMASASKTIYFVKTHDLPIDDEKTIYIVRDGRSSVVSYYHYIKQFSRGTTVTVEDIIVGDCEFGSWSDHFEGWNPMKRPNTLLLRYEDLAQAPGKALKLISDFTGYPVVSERPPSFAELKAINPNFFRSGGDAGNIGELKGQDLGLFWLLHGRLMTDLGYANAGPGDLEFASLGTVIRRRLVGARRVDNERERKKLAEEKKTRWWRLGRKLRTGQG